MAKRLLLFLEQCVANLDDLPDYGFLRSPGLTMVTQLADFTDTVHDAQQTFRVLLNDFWQQRDIMTAEYPLGFDYWFFAQQQIVGLPRTSKLLLREAT